MENNDWFGIVRWCDEDIAAKLEDMGLEPSEDNIRTVRCYLENGHQLTDAMIEAGWMVIECAIDETISARTRQLDNGEDI